MNFNAKLFRLAFIRLWSEVEMKFVRALFFYLTLLVDRTFVPLYVLGKVRDRTFLISTYILRWMFNIKFEKNKVHERTIHIFRRMLKVSTLLNMQYIRRDMSKRVPFIVTKARWIFIFTCFKV